MIPEGTNVDADGPTDQIGKIPVRNLWLLMLYASHLFQHVGRGKVAVESNPDDIPDLVAEILARMVEKRLKRNLTFGYRSEYAVLSRVRGRIDLLETERSHLLLRGKVACRFENLTVNTPRNRYVRAALTVVARIVHRRELAHRCRVLASSLERLGVSADVPTRAEMSTAHGRNDVDDQLMIAAARLAFDLVLPTETTGNRHLSLPSRNAVWVRKLYEKAVGGFYDVVLSPCGWRVRMGQAFEWQISHQTSRIAAILPTMRTDVVLLNDETGHRIVIDTKFNSILTRGWFRNDSLRSGYLYQMYAYLRSQIADGDPSSEQASGLLLHPSVGEMVDESVVIQGHAIRFGTVDLAASATAIRAQLLRLVQVSSIDPEGRHPPGGGDGG